MSFIDWMRSIVPKLPKMGICDLNMCLRAKTKKKMVSFFRPGNRVGINFCVPRVQILACSSVEGQNIRVYAKYRAQTPKNEHLWPKYVLARKNYNASGCIKFALLKNAWQKFLIAHAPIFVALVVCSCASLNGCKARRANTTNWVRVTQNCSW